MKTEIESCSLSWPLAFHVMKPRLFKVPFVPLLFYALFVFVFVYLYLFVFVFLLIIVLVFVISVIFIWTGKLPCALHEWQHHLRAAKEEQF